MASFTFAQLRDLWLFANGPAAQADIAAAIALAESSGCQYALAGPEDVRPVKQCVYRRTTGENSVGLWQINVQAHPQYDVAALFEPHFNAGAAVAVSGQGQSFTPWTTYTSGAYRAFLPSSSAAGAAAAGASGRGAVPRVRIGVGAQGGAVAETKPVSVLKAWHMFTLALGETMPTQAHRARRARNKFMTAVRFPSPAKR